MDQYSSVELGSLDLFSTTTGLRLQLSSELDISSFAGNDVPLNQNDFLRLKLAQSPFIQRANGFRISLHVHFDASLTSTMEDDISAKLTYAMETATKLWSALQLQPLSINVSASSQSSFSCHISIVLCHTDSTTHAVKKARHKLDIHVPFHVVQPPLGVRTLSLNAVQLTMHINHNKRRGQTSLARHCSASPVLAIADRTEVGHVAPFDYSNQKAQNGTTVDVLTAGLALHPAGNEDTDGQSIRYEHHDRMLSSFSESPFSPSPSPVSLWRPARDAKVSPPPFQLVPMQGIRTTGGPQPVQTLPFSSDDFVQIITSGFREAIADLPRRRLDNRITHGKNTFQRLSSVAPALFSPNYLSNVSGRAVFLPLLSHALLKVGLKNAKSKSLRSKTSQLLQVDPTIDLATCTEHESPEQENIASKLFCLVQRGVYDSKASKRLPSFAVPANDRPSSDQEPMSTILEPAEDTHLTHELELLDDDEFGDEFNELAGELEDFDSLSVFTDDGGEDGDFFTPSKEATYTYSASSSQGNTGAFFRVHHKAMVHEAYPYSSGFGTNIAAPGLDLEDDQADDDLLSICDGSCCETKSQCLTAETSHDIWDVGDGEEMLLD